MRHASPSLARAGTAPVPLSERAEENLRFIRDTMERSSRFTDVSGLGLALIGVTALAAAAIAARQPDEGRWLLVWLGEAALAVGIGLGATGHKARGDLGRLVSGPARKYAFGLLPPLVAGALLSGALWREELVHLLPATWLTLYGAAIIAAGTHSIGLLRLLGLSFMGLGSVAFLAPAAAGDWLLALGFGALHLGFGLRIASRHGG